MLPICPSRLASLPPPSIRTDQPLSPEDWAVLDMEFAPFAVRNPEARRKLADLDEVNITQGGRAHCR